MSIEKITLEEFLKRNRISEEDWKLANMSYESLKQIGIHHESKMEELNKEAEHIASRMQSIKEVHSVRWRVKDAEHLMEKIVRKRKQKPEAKKKTKPNKYEKITTENYTQIVTDLIGVRVLHLFKNEWIDVHKKILGLWNKKEKPMAYIRDGDDQELKKSYVENGCNVEPHPAAYRSIHYIISSKFTKTEILCEIQVRTIFEEGWSEIDHRIRYPNFSDNEVITQFLQIFNRLAGSADEMGTFISSLSQSIKQIELERAAQAQEIEGLEEEVSRLLEQLESKDDTTDKVIGNLSAKIRRLTELHRVTADSPEDLSANRVKTVLHRLMEASESKQALGLAATYSAHLYQTE